MTTEKQHSKNLKRAEFLMDKEEFECGLNSEFEFELEQLIDDIEEEEDKIKLWRK